MATSCFSPASEAVNRYSAAAVHLELSRMAWERMRVKHDELTREYEAVPIALLREHVRTMDQILRSEGGYKELWRRVKAQHEVAS